MVREIKDELKRKITGTKNPSNKRLIYAILVLILVFILGFYFNKLLEKINEKTDVEIHIEPYLKDVANKKYLPLIVNNIGDVKIKNALVKISTCDMTNDNGTKFYNYYPIDLIQEKTHIELQFADKNTISNFSKMDCSPEVPFYERAVNSSLYFNPYTLNKTISTNAVICGVCYYDVYFISDVINKKFANLSFVYPVNLNITIFP